MECERFCSATEGCTAASYYQTLVGDKNCWLKKIATVACAVPTDAKDDPNSTLLLKDTCTPTAPVAPATYVAFAGKDYAPNSVVANLVTVMASFFPIGATMQFENYSRFVLVCAVRCQRKLTLRTDSK